MTFKFHSDPGHGWLAVKLSLVQSLGLSDDISEYSYMRGDTAYLEEDWDLTQFFTAYESRYGVKPTIERLDPSRGDSPIRHYKRFQPTKQAAVIMPLRV